MIGPEFLQQPHHFDMAVCLLLQATTRTQAVEITLEVELQEIARGIARAPCHSRDGALEAAGCQVEFVDKGIDKADGMVLGNVVVEALRESDHFVAVHAVDIAHEGTKLRERKEASFCSWQCYSLPKHCVFTQSGALLGPL